MPRTCCFSSGHMVRAALLIAVLTLGAVRQSTPIIAQETSQGVSSSEERPTPSLKLGDPAPELRVSNWLQGDPVKSFEPGKIYVVEFWATWCAPCIGNMPHLAELQAKYKDQGVTVIAFTSKDIRETPGNSEEATAAFVKK